MPAQKLTKGRLIQILVSLTVLIIAFTWRTFHHDEIVSDTMKTASCSSYPCTIQTKDNEFGIPPDRALKGPRLFSGEYSRKWKETRARWAEREDEKFNQMFERIKGDR